MTDHQPGHSDEVTAAMAPTGEPNRGALSVEQIEQDWWGDPPANATNLVRTAHELRRKPVASLTAEDLRLLIGQRIGIDELLPYALIVLYTAC
jgi:hypothetical protein